MSIATGVIGSVIGGVIGGAVWAGIVYGTGYEVGYVACGVGALAGLGMAVGSQKTAGPPGGIVAVLVAVTAILAAKYAVVHFMMQNMMAGMPTAAQMSEEDLKLYMAHQVTEEYVDKNKALNWPDGMDAENASQPKDYPPELWKDVEARFKAMTPEDVKKYRDDIDAQMSSVIGATSSAVAWQAFLAGFGAMDILFFVLAIAAAYQFGAATEG